jgi:hypothetical protein
MPALSTKEAAERLARVVEKAKTTVLLEIHDELFPEKPVALPLSAVDLAEYIRGSLEAEEVDLWNVVFPAHRDVWYNEQDGEIHYNEAMVGYADAN